MIVSSSLEGELHEKLVSPCCNFVPTWAYVGLVYAFMLAGNSYVRLHAVFKDTISLQSSTFSDSLANYIPLFAFGGGVQQISSLKN